MDNTNSSVADTSVGVEIAEQASVPAKRIVPRQRRNVRMIQNVFLIWLDQNIDDNNVDCRNTIAQLRSVVNRINVFTDEGQCVNFLTKIHMGKACMIISDSLCRNVVPLAHDVAQLHSIFIFCENKTEHEQWIKDWSKIKGVFTEISSICKALKQTLQQCEQNVPSISSV